MGKIIGGEILEVIIELGLVEVHKEIFSLLLEFSLVNQATLLSVSTMLNQFCVRHSACASMAPVQNAARIFGKTLQEGCQPYNEKHHMKRSVLMELYKDVQENPEIRISSYFQAMKCPTSALLQTVKATLREEPSPQVGSFVWSHLTQLMETTDLLKTDIKKMLTPDLLSKDFKLEPWRYSWYNDATVYSERLEASANVETSAVFSPKSFIPRSLMINFTVNVLGKSINLFEVGGHVENLETMLEKYFPHNKEKTQKSVHGENPHRQKKSCVHARTNRNFFPHFTENGEVKHSCLTSWNEVFLRNSSMNHIISSTQPTESKKTVEKELLSCSLGLKIFGNELSYFECQNWSQRAKYYSLNLADTAIKFLKGEVVEFKKSNLLLAEEVVFPTIAGLPLRLSVNASSFLDATLQGNADLRSFAKYFIEGHIRPTAQVQVSARMGVEGEIGKAALEWVGTTRTSFNVKGGLKMKNRNDFKLFLNTPEKQIEVVKVSSKFYMVSGDERKPIVDTRAKRNAAGQQYCTSSEYADIFGWKLCSQRSYPTSMSGSFSPLAGHAVASLQLQKTDLNLQKYLLEGKYNFQPQKTSFCPKLVDMHFFLGTPGSNINRNISLDVLLNCPDMKLKINFIHPQKTIKIFGDVQNYAQKKTVDLGVMVDEDAYFMKGVILSTVRDEFTRLKCLSKLQLSPKSPPIMLSVNYTHIPGKHLVIVSSLENIFDGPASVKVKLQQDRKPGSRARRSPSNTEHYSGEMNINVPKVFGTETKGYLQQRQQLWTSGLKIKYGLFGEAKELPHECQMEEKLKLGLLTQPPNLLLKHNFYCTQKEDISHKLNIQQNTKGISTSTKMEFSYGEKWKEKGNKYRLSFNQKFKNRTSFNGDTDYIIQWHLRYPPRNLDVHTSLKHAHALGKSYSVNTSIKAVFNSKNVFNASLQVDETSSNPMWFWNGNY
uniref:apolipophorins-like n=1 Tax=Myxine glutinosa TaxID=7769 RepID=UPI00358EB507